MKWWNSFETPSREVPTQAAQFAPLKGFAANLVPLTDPMHCSASANTSLQDLKRFRDLSWATQNWSNHKWMDEQCWTMLNKSSCRGTQCLTLFLEKCWEVARPFRIQMKADSSARSLFSVKHDSKNIKNHGKCKTKCKNDYINMLGFNIYIADMAVTVQLFQVVSDAWDDGMTGATCFSVSLGHVGFWFKCRKHLWKKLENNAA